MKIVILIGSLFFSVPSFCQIADAGKDKRVFLTQSSTTTIGGKSFGTAFKWKKISTGPADHSIITSPGSPVTSVKHLSQGTWYYELKVSKGGIIKKDTVVIRVDYDIPPANSVLVRDFPMSQLVPLINIRDDTTRNWNYSDPTYKHTQMDVSENEVVYLERDRLNSMFLDKEKGKFYSIIEDGYGGDRKHGRYARTEIHYGSYYAVDTSKTYVFEWKGYFPQNSDFISPGKDLNVIWQLHAHDDYSPPFQIMATRNTLNWVECVAPSNARTVTKPIADYSDFYNKTRTIRITLKEGLAGSGAFVKVEIDGIQKYLRNYGNIGRTFGHDYIKFATLYDWGRAIVDPDMPFRGRKFSLVTESFKIYVLK